MSSDVDMATLGLPVNEFLDLSHDAHISNLKEQYWGMVFTNIDLEPILNGTDPCLRRLNGDYDYTLWQPGLFSRLIDVSVPR